MDKHRYSDILDRKSILEVWIARGEYCGEYRLVFVKSHHNLPEDYVEQDFS